MIIWLIVIIFVALVWGCYLLAKEINEREEYYL